MSSIMATRNITLRRFGNFLNKLPSKYRGMLSEISEDLGKDFGRRARGRAKGRLRSLKVRMTGKNNAVVEYKDNELGKIARYVNEGAYPKHKIPAALMEYSRAGVPTAGRKGKSVIGDLSSLPPELRKWVQPRPSSSKGFLDKAFSDTRKQAPKIIIKKLKQAVEKSL